MQRTPLSEELVGLIMLKLSLTYGKRFANSYDADPDMLRTHWASELSGLSPESVAYALARLPADRVPNVLEFRMLASNRPPSEFKALPAPLASPAVRQEQLQALQGLREVFLKSKRHVDIAWAQRIAANPDRYSYYARKLAANVLAARGLAE